METIFRTLGIYIFLIIVTRLSGKRTLSELSTFEFILLIIIAEATQNALIGTDYSVTNAYISITTLIIAEIGLSLLKQKYDKFTQILEGNPVIILENGRPISERMKKHRVDEADILEAARRLQGIERLDQIKFAVLEKTGGITVIPKKNDESSELRDIT